jgi:hypothetical protein
VNVMTDDESFDSEKARLRTLLAEDVGSDLAKLAQISETSFMQFCDLLATAIIQANRDTPYARELTRASDVSPSLDRVATAAQALDKALGALFGEGNSFGKHRGGAALAGCLLEEAITDAVAGGGDTTIGYPRLTAYRRWLATLATATAESKRRATERYLPSRRGRRKGAGGNLFFNNFVKSLQEIARMTGGRWTHYRHRNSTEWQSTLRPALDILRPYLPAKEFIPVADLDRSVAHVLDQLKKIDPPNITPSAR